MGAPTKTESVSKKTDAVEVSAAGKAADTKLDSHHNYEFGGPWGVTAMIVFFPMLMYYLWICCTFYDGQVELPTSTADIQPFFYRMLGHIREDASPSPWAIKVYSTYFFFQLFIAWVIPGFKQEGLPVPSLGYKTLMYNCNAYQCFYLSIALAGVLHFADIFHLASIIEHFGELMTVAIIYGFGVSVIMYFWTVLRNEQIRMSGNFMYDFWMGACLNPRLGSVDLKLWAEVRIPWMMLFFISLSGASKQFDDYGYVSANMWFKVLATFLFANACGKSEECIPQTWDIFYEKWGFMIIFWNFAGVPFTYCYSDVYMATHDPAKYQFSTIGYVALYGTLLTSYYIFDTAMGQKSNFKMQMQGVFRSRKTFPQLPGNVVENPRFIQTAHGNKLLVDGWWRVVRKPNYTADWFQVLSWALVVWTASPIPYFYPLFFTAMLLHRTGRDFERCAIKYGKDWDEYCRIVPYRFVPYVY